MPINIKNHEADLLVRELAELTGETITEAVMIALRERLERERSQRSRSRAHREIMRIRERYQALPLVNDRSPDEIVGYDDLGLPT